MSPFGKATHLLPLGVGSLAVLVVPWFWSAHARRTLGDPAMITGWWLFAVFVLLGAFNARKKLAALPLGRASTWLRLHVAGGFLALALFWLHTGSLWPTGTHRQALAGSFYLLSFSGLVGWLLQRTYPRQLADTGREIIYERIPAEIARLRNAADRLVLDATRDSGSDTLARHYMETLHWFFRRPRFFVNHAFFGGKHARAWVRQQCEVVRPYLGAAERERLDRLADWPRRRSASTSTTPRSRFMKRWLLLHLPLAAVASILVVWHVLMVHLYSDEPSSDSTGRLRTAELPSSLRPRSRPGERPSGGSESRRNLLAAAAPLRAPFHPAGSARLADRLGVARHRVAVGRRFSFRSRKQEALPLRRSGGAFKKPRRLHRRGWLRRVPMKRTKATSTAC